MIVFCVKILGAGLTEIFDLSMLSYSCQQMTSFSMVCSLAPAKASSPDSPGPGLSIRLTSARHTEAAAPKVAGRFHLPRCDCRMVEWMGAFPSYQLDRHVCMDD